MSDVQDTAGTSPETGEDTPSAQVDEEVSPLGLLTSPVEPEFGEPDYDPVGDYPERSDEEAQTELIIDISTEEGQAARVEGTRDYAETVQSMIPADPPLAADTPVENPVSEDSVPQEGDALPDQPDDPLAPPTEPEPEPAPAESPGQPADA